jgi:putative transposase
MESPGSPHRRTRRRVEHTNHLRFLTFSCYHRLPLLRNPRIAAAFVDRLARERNRLRFALIAWVVMPDHVHLLLWPAMQVAPVPRILRDLKGPFGRAVLSRWSALDAPILGRLAASDGIRHFWQLGGGYDRNVFSDKEIAEKIDYIHLNPVRRGLAERANDWTWSSARWYAGVREGQLAIDPVRRPSPVGARGHGVGEPGA